MRRNAARFFPRKICLEIWFRMVPRGSNEPEASQIESCSSLFDPRIGEGRSDNEKDCADKCHTKAAAEQAG